MRSLRRLALVAAFACAAAVGAAPATAAYAPRIVVTAPKQTPRGAETRIRLTFPRTDDATARFTLYVPEGYRVALPAIGATVGTARINEFAKQLGNTNVVLSGPISASDPNATAVRTLATACTGSPAHAAIWTLVLSRGGSGLNRVDIAAFVDRTLPAEAALGAYKIVVCLRSPDVPEAEGGQPLGGQPVDADLKLDNVLIAPTNPQDLLWRAMFVPYRPGTGLADAAAAVESQSVVRVPIAVTLTRAVKRNARTVAGRRRTRVFGLVSGRVSEGGAPLAQVQVEILVTREIDGKFKRVKRAVTGESGRFSFRFKLVRTVYFRARAVAPDRTASCAGPSIAPGGCTGATISGFDVTTNVITVAPPRPPPPRVR